MADTHVHEDDLTLLYYDELAEADARAARAHLERCARVPGAAGGAGASPGDGR